MAPDLYVLYFGYIYLDMWPNLKSPFSTRNIFQPPMPTKFQWEDIRPLKIKHFKTLILNTLNNASSRFSLSYNISYITNFNLRSTGLEKAIMLGMVGQRKRGRPRRRWLDDVQDITGLSLQVAKEVDRDRCKWRQIVTEVKQ